MQQGQQFSTQFPIVQSNHRHDEAIQYLDALCMHATRASSKAYTLNYSGSQTFDVTLYGT
jgi:hypothetical protein